MSVLFVTKSLIEKVCSLSCPVGAGRTNSALTDGYLLYFENKLYLANVSE